MADEPSQIRMLRTGRAQKARRRFLGSSVCHHPLLVLVLVSMLADSVSVYVLPGSFVGEGKFVRCNAHYRTISFVKFSYSAVENSLSRIVYVSQAGGAVR